MSCGLLCSLVSDCRETCLATAAWRKLAWAVMSRTQLQVNLWSPSGDRNACFRSVGFSANIGHVQTGATIMRTAKNSKGLSIVLTRSHEQLEMLGYAHQNGSRWSQAENVWFQGHRYATVMSAKGRTATKLKIVNITSCTVSCTFNNTEAAKSAQ